MMMRWLSAYAPRALLCLGLLVAMAGCSKVGVEENTGADAGAGSPPPAAESPAGGESVERGETVTLNWTPPAENADGSFLSDLAGYRIYSGQSEEDLEHRETVSNPGLSSYVIDELREHELFFAITAMNSSGAESPLSEAVRTPAG
jgi:hypothetical protein